MAFKSGGRINNRTLHYGKSTDDINTLVKFQGDLLWLTDTKAWKTYDVTEGWIDYEGDPVALNTALGEVSESNPLPIKTSLLSGATSVVYNAISATPVTPYTLVLEGMNVKEIKLVTSGTSTSRTMTFKAKLRSEDTFKPFMGVNFSDVNNTLATSTTGKDEIWTFSGLDGVHSVEFNVTAIAGGTFSVWATVLS